jgi:hypothetical protein
LRAHRLLVGALVAGTLSAVGCGGDDEVSQGERDRAVAAAKRVYRGVAGSASLSQGPCIAERLPGLPDWVVDVAHDPRQDVDDDPANQCRRYREGEASHFVELDPSGRLIRAE